MRFLRVIIVAAVCINSAIANLEDFGSLFEKVKLSCRGDEVKSLINQSESQLEPLNTEIAAIELKHAKELARVDARIASRTVNYNKNIQFVNYGIIDVMNEEYRDKMENYYESRGIESRIEDLKSENAEANSAQVTKLTAELKASEDEGKRLESVFEEIYAGLRERKRNLTAIYTREVTELLVEKRTILSESTAKCALVKKRRNVQEKYLNEVLRLCSDSLIELPKTAGRPTSTDTPRKFQWIPNQFELNFGIYNVGVTFNIPKNSVTVGASGSKPIVIRARNLNFDLIVREFTEEDFRHASIDIEKKLGILSFDFLAADNFEWKAQAGASNRVLVDEANESAFVCRFANGTANLIPGIVNSDGFCRYGGHQSELESRFFEVLSVP